MRHAKSDRDADYDHDRDRPLSDRGVRSAVLMGRLVAHLGISPRMALTSTAVRARDTTHLAAAAGDWDCEIREEGELYASSPDRVLSVAAGARGEPLMLVGHEPIWSTIIERLTGEPVVMKTASLAVIEVDISSWASLPSAGGDLRAMYHPRAYFESEWDPGPSAPGIIGGDELPRGTMGGRDIGHRR